MKKTYLWIILAGILWGTSGIFVRWLTPYGFTSFPLTAFRGGIAFLSIAGYCLLRERSAFRIRKEQWPVFLGIGVIQFATAACYFLCMQMTSVATAVVLMCTAPVYVILFSVLVTKEPLSLPKGIAIGGMLLGCVLVSGLIDGAVFHGWGIAIGILSGISKGSYSLLVKKALKQGELSLESCTLRLAVYVAVGASIDTVADCRRGGLSSPFFGTTAFTWIGTCHLCLPLFLVRQRTAAHGAGNGLHPVRC